VGMDIEGFEEFDVISIDDEEGACRAAEHLRALGHRDVAVVLIAEHPDSPVDEQHGISGRRLHGIRRGFGLDPSADESADGTVRLRIMSTPVSEEGGRAVLQAILADGDPPTAVMTMSDVTAIGIMAEAHEAGVRVPE